MKKTLFAILLASLLLAGCKVVPETTSTTLDGKAEATAAAALAALPSEPAPTSAPTAEPTVEPTPIPTAQAAVAEELFKVLISSSQPNFSRIVWSRDGSRIGLIASDHAAVLDAQTLTPIFSYADPSSMVLDLSPDGQTLLTTGDQQTLLLTDLSTNETRSLDTGAMFVSASFSPEGSLILVGTMDNWKAKIYDAASGSLRVELTGFETAAPVYSARFAENILDILWISRGEVQIQNIASGELKPAFNHEDFVSAAARAHNLALVATSAAGTLADQFVPILYIWDADSGEKLLEIPLTQSVYALNFSADDSLLAAGSSDGVHVFKTADMSEVILLTDQSNGVVDARFSPIDQRLATLDGDGTLRVYQLTRQP